MIKVKDDKIMNNIEKISDFIGKWILVILGVTASLGAFADVFQIPVSMPVVFAVAVTAPGILLAITKMKTKYRRIALIVLGIIMFISIIILRKTLVNGICSAANNVIKVFNEYFGGEGMAFYKIKEHGGIFNEPIRYNTLLFCIVAIIYCYLAVTVTWYKMFASVHILLSMIFVIPGLILGKMPNSAYVALIVIYYLLCLMYQHNRRVYLGRMLAVAMLCASVVGLIFLFNRPSEYNAEERYRKYSERLNKMADKLNLEDWSVKGLKSLFENKKTATGGINGGKLGEVAEIKYSGDVMLRLKLKPDRNNLYLKGFVANEYTGNSWKDMSNSHAGIYNKFILKDDYTDLDLFTHNNSYYYEDKMNSLTVSYDKDTKDYRFFPYFWDVGESDSMSLIYDLRPKTDNKNSYFYSYASIGDNEYYGYWNDDEISEAFEELYFDISYDLPSNISDMFDEILDEPVHYDLTPDGLEKCVKYVKNYLSANTSYSLKPGALDKGEDYVVDFLTNKKKGYCTAYASAAVLMFRYLGVPARYVEGYVVTSGEMGKITPDEDGYINIPVKDYAAHAWAEIYVPGLGFVPVEVTPGYFSTQSSGGGEERTTPAAPEENTTTERKSETTTTAEPKEVTTKEGKETITTNKTEIESKKNTNYVYGIVGIVIILCGVSVCLYKVSEKKKRLLDYKTPDLRHNIIVLSVMFNKYLGKLNIRHSKDVYLSGISEEINRRIDGYYASLKGGAEVRMHLRTEDTRQVLEIIWKAKYCDENTKITTDEYDKVRQYVEEFKNSLQYLKNKV